MSVSYNPAIPNPPDAPSADVGIMQTNSSAISTIIAVDHVGFNRTAGGQHNQVTFAATNVPTTPTTPPVLFTNNDAFSVPQLFFYTGTNSSFYNVGTSGSTILMGGLILQWAQLTSTNGQTQNFPFPFPNNVFSMSVTDRSGGATPQVFTVAGYSKTNFTLYYSGGGGTRNFFLIAIGN